MKTLGRENRLERESVPLFPVQHSDSFEPGNADIAENINSLLKQSSPRADVPYQGYNIMRCGDW
ncbi:hypothetical protein JOB18_030400 [Solea senegalensis]|uniref:Uncharacterized protein n=1 Tax=Solea senegalensis TaxID=28829 RepID=A0AAV6T0E8_SOLSE|nr:hypothetical protein JOB18_030400 [Solea senegalensis]